MGVNPVALSRMTSDVCLCTSTVGYVLSPVIFIICVLDKTRCCTLFIYAMVHLGDPRTPGRELVRRLIDTGHVLW